MCTTLALFVIIIHGTVHWVLTVCQVLHLTVLRLNANLCLNFHQLFCPLQLVLLSWTSVSSFANEDNYIIAVRSLWWGLSEIIHHCLTWFPTQSDSLLNKELSTWITFNRMHVFKSWLCYKAMTGWVTLLLWASVNERVNWNVVIVNSLVSQW